MLKSDLKMPEFMSDKNKIINLPLSIEEMEGGSVVNNETGELKKPDVLIENKLFWIEVKFQKLLEGAGGFDFTEYIQVGVHPIEESRLKEKLLNKLNDETLEAHQIKIIGSQKIDETVARHRMDERFTAKLAYLQEDTK
jgi:hypothetical protein